MGRSRVRSVAEAETNDSIRIRAFQMLVRSSQDTNLKPTAVAQWLTSPDGRRSR